MTRSFVGLLGTVAIIIAASGEAVLAQAPAPVATGSVRGRVVDADGKAKPWTVLRFDAPNLPSRTVGADANGDYQVVGLSPGSYTVFALPQWQWPFSLASDIEIQQGEVIRNLVVRRPWARRGVLLTSILLYLFTLLLFRHYNIVRPAREVLRAQSRAVHTRLLLEGDPSRHTDLQTLVKLLDLLRKGIDARPWSEMFFWSQGREIATWQSLHEIERQFVAFMVPPERVLESLHSAAADLRSISSPAATALVVRIGLLMEDLKSCSGAPAGPQVSEERIKQILAETLAVVYGERDTSFAGLMEWHNKAMWLVMASLLAITILALVFDHAELFLIGAAGGLMSRMARSLYRADVPTDYGASWTTLFLSPLLGAIGAWAGILLIIALHNLGVLGQTFKDVSWNADAMYSPLVMALGIALGFSERLFMALLSGVEGKVDAQLRAAGQGSGATTASGTTAGIASSPTVGGASRPTATAAPDVLIRQLDAKAGERVAIVADAASATRQKLQAALPGVTFHSVTVAQLVTVAPLDGVIIETLPDAAGLDALGATLFAALSPGGRAVLIGQTPAMAFDAASAAHLQRNHPGPTLLSERLTAARLIAQEPPEKMGNTDPVRWSTVFTKE